MKPAVVGIGEIALGQHVPSLNHSSDRKLAARVSCNARVTGHTLFATWYLCVTAQVDAVRNQLVEKALSPLPAPWKEDVRYSPPLWI